MALAEVGLGGLGEQVVQPRDALNEKNLSPEASTTDTIFPLLSLG